MDSRRQSPFYGSHNQWQRSYDGGHSSAHPYNFRDQDPFQNRYPEEWRNPRYQEAKSSATTTGTSMMRQRQKRSAVNPLVKHFLFTINVLFLVVGVATTSLSVYVLTETDETVECLLDFLFSPACLLCLLGCLVVVPAFMGCYGALRENTCVIKLYYIVSIVLLFIEIVAVIFFFVFTLVPDALSNINIYPADFMEDGILKYGNRVYEEDSGCGRDSDDYIDLIQDKFSCCGYSNDDEGYLDWEANPYYSCNSTGPEACSVPISCCKADTTTSDCGANLLRPGTTDVSAIYTQGCEKAMRKVFEDNIIVIACCAFGSIILQIIFTRCGMRLNSQVMEQRSKW